MWSLIAEVQRSSPCPPFWELEVTDLHETYKRAHTLFMYLSSVPSSNAVAMANLQVGMFSCTSNDGVGGATITSYQWVKNGVALSNGGRVAGANQPTLSISNVMPQDQGLYQCNVTNVDGVTSLSISSSFVVSGETCAIVKKRELDETYVLTLDTVIVTQPSNQSGVAPGSNVTFSVYAVHVVRGDGGSISYVWTYSNGSQLAGDRFQGTNTSALTISPVLGSDNGSSFICTVSGSSGVYITSQPVSLNALGMFVNEYIPLHLAYLCVVAPPHMFQWIYTLQLRKWKYSKLHFCTTQPFITTHLLICKHSFKI